jgi:hypothetical protein
MIALQSTDLIIQETRNLPEATMIRMLARPMEHLATKTSRTNYKEILHLIAASPHHQQSSLAPLSNWNCPKGGTPQDLRHPLAFPAQVNTASNKLPSAHLLSIDGQWRPFPQSQTQEIPN